MTVCYDSRSGDELWRHGVENMFSEVVSGPGPRATPTIADHRLLSFGARGFLTCLDAVTGQEIWQRDLMSEFDGQLPMWGYSGSPLVYESLCIVFAGGPADNGLIAFDLEAGEVVWEIAAPGRNFSSPQLCRFGESSQVLFGTSDGLISIDPQTGVELWSTTPGNWRGPAMVQPQQIGESSVIVPLGDGIGVARIDVESNGDEWSVTEVWSSRDLKPSFNDFVYHDGFLYGFDQSIFACVDAETGERQWKKGRYGFGQVLLLEQSAALVIQQESGQIVVVKASPQQHTEIATLDALTDKTWNHPIVASGRLFVRNGVEMVCFELPGSEQLTE